MNIQENKYLNLLNVDQSCCQSDVGHCSTRRTEVIQELNGATVKVVVRHEEVGLFFSSICSD